MKIYKKQAQVLQEAIENWNRSGLLDEKTSALLYQDIEVIPFDWKRLAKYSFWISIICIVISFVALFADKALVELLNSIFNAPYIAKFITLSIFSVAIYWLGLRRRAAHPNKIFSNEAILFLGVLVTAGTIYQLGNVFDSGSGHFSVLLLLASIVYGMLGYFFRSILIWIFALISLGSWLGAETGYASGWAPII